MHRTLQTATIALDWLLDKGVPAQADARWQENSAKPCDTGSALSAVAAADPGSRATARTAQPCARASRATAPPWQPVMPVTKMVGTDMAAMASGVV